MKNKVHLNWGINHDRFYRVMNAVLRLYEGSTEIKINKIFNFEEISKAKEVIKLIGEEKVNGS